MKPQEPKTPAIFVSLLDKWKKGSLSDEDVKRNNDTIHTHVTIIGRDPE